LKFKIPTQEAHEVMEIYFKITGEKIKTEEKLERVYKILSEYKKKHIKIHA
jgi:hypothetical protein